MQQRPTIASQENEQANNLSAVGRQTELNIAGRQGIDLL